MSLFSLTISKDDAWAIMEEIGRISALQFVDLNVKEQQYAKAFSGYVKRCDEIERKMRYFPQYFKYFRFIEEESKKYEMNLIKPKNPEEFLMAVNKKFKEGKMVIIHNKIDWKYRPEMLFWMNMKIL